MFFFHPSCHRMPALLPIFTRRHFLQISPAPPSTMPSSVSIHNKRSDPVLYLWLPSLVPDQKSATDEKKRKNEELERALRESKDRKAMHMELLRTWECSRVMEERLCRQLGELEAKLLIQTRDYNTQI